jgi:hypothetical protein
MPLTELQKRFVKAIVDLRESGEEKGIATKAARLAGYREESAAQAAHSNMKSQPVLDAMVEEMRSRKMDVDISKEGVDEITEEWVLRGLRNLALTAKSDNARLEAYKVIGKWRRLKLWDEAWQSPVEPIREQKRLLGRINELIGQLGGQPFKLTAGVALQFGGLPAVAGAKPDRRGDTDADAEGFPIGCLRGEVVFGGDGERKDICNGDGLGDADDGGASASKDGADSGAADICKSDGALADGQCGQGLEAGDREVVKEGLHRELRCEAPDTLHEGEQPDEGVKG